MPSAMQTIKNAIGKLVFREMAVEAVQSISSGFLELELASASLSRVRFTPGDKIQILLDEGPRTYTPYAFDAERGRMSLLVYTHGQSSSNRFAKTVKAGDRVHGFGPRGSIDLPQLNGPVLLVGDETSFALARALLDFRGDSKDLGFVFEVNDATDARPVLERLRLSPDHMVSRASGDGHYPEVERRVRAALDRNAQTQLVLTGKAQSIQALRAALKARPASHAVQKNKAYWAPGKKGID